MTPYVPYTLRDDRPCPACEHVSFSATEAKSHALTHPATPEGRASYRTPAPVQRASNVSLVLFRTRLGEWKCRATATSIYGKPWVVIGGERTTCTGAVRDALVLLAVEVDIEDAEIG